jgi:hypothetical protein
MMSLEPHWYSSIYGAIVIAGGVVAAHAVAVIGLSFTSADARRVLHITRPQGREADTQQFAEVLNDLGNLLLAFIMVWTYFSFSQFFLIWSANLPSEIAWYERRLAGGWQVVAVAIVFVCFAAPFLMLLSRDVKRQPGRLAAVAALVLAGYVLHMFWNIVPALPTGGRTVQLAMLGAVVSTGGLWTMLFGWGLGRIGKRLPGS